MPQIGPITIPEYAATETFPLDRVDYGYGVEQQPQIITHDFATAHRKVHQRFVLGDGVRRITIGRAGLSDAECVTLLRFWEDLGGAFKPFFFTDPATGDQLTVCFADPALRFDALTDGLSSFAVTLAVIPSTVPDYPINSAATRFPSQQLNDGLLDQVQVIVPLVRIAPQGCDPIYVADRHCKVGGIEYLPRLLDWAGIGQTLGDQAQTKPASPWAMRIGSSASW